jgi:putative ABC transport system permease protein
MGPSAIRHAIRSLAATPSLTLLVIVTLGVGLGATTAVASIVDAVLLARLPFRDADRLVVVWEVNRDRPDGSHGVGRNVAGPANFIRWRERAATLESMTFLAGGHGTLSIPVSRTVTGAGEPARVPAAYVGGTFFEVVGARPIAGRLLRAEDAVEGAEPVVVVSERWALRQQRAPASLPGERVVIDGERITVVGVVDRAFDLPHGAEIWSAMPEARFAEARGRWMGVVARLAPTATRAAAQQEMQAIAAALEAETPERNAGWDVNVQPLSDELVAVVRPGLTAVALAALCVLTVACLNVANLLLARALARHRDAAIRLALGARAHRLVSQALAEGLVLALAGGALGLLLAAWGLGTFQVALQGLLGTAAPFSVDGRVLGAGIALALATGLLFSALPAWLMARRIRIGGLGDGRTISAGRTTGTLRRTLVVSEIALALVLSLGAGGLVRSYWTLSRVDPGFDAAQVLTARVAPAGPLYSEDGAVGAYLTRLVGRIRAMSDV